MDSYLSWFVYVLSSSLGVVAVTFLGYAIGGAIGAYVMSAIMLTAEISDSIYDSTNTIQPEISLPLGFGIPLLLMLPGILIRYGLAKKPLSLLKSAGIAFFLWFVVMHSVFANPMGIEYSGILAAMTLWICFTGFSHPFRKAKLKRIQPASGLTEGERMLTVNFNDGKPSGWVDEKQVFQWYTDGKIDASTWVYPSDSREWQRLEDACSLLPSKGPGVNETQPTAPQRQRRADTQVAETPARRPQKSVGAPAHSPRLIFRGSSQLQNMESSELMAELESGKLGPRAVEEVVSELKRRGITVDQ